MSSHELHRSPTISPPQVSIVGSARLRLVPHPLNDPNEFGSLADLHGISRKEGYQGGLILLQVIAIDCH